tara:strand:- start:782 stop:1111 length:330 start_codon:yes stop_codon:yes gene_type:complete
MIVAKRPRTVRRWLAAAGLSGLAAAGCIAAAGPARADVVDDYTAQNAHTVCAVLDRHPHVAGVEGIVLAIVQDGLTPYSAGQVVGYSVWSWCPEHSDLVDAFVAKWAGR